MLLISFLNRKFWWQKKLPRPVKVMQVMVGLGIALSVAALLTTLSVANGFESEFKKALLEFHAHITVQPPEGEALSKEEILKIAPSASVTPYLYREALLIHKGVVKGVVLKGIEEFGDEGLVLGEAVGKKLGLQMDSGQRPATRGVTMDRGPTTSCFLSNVTTPEGGRCPLSTVQSVKLLIPKGQKLSAQDTRMIKIDGFFKSGLHEIDDQFVLLDLKQLQKLFGLKSSAYGFEIKLPDPDLAPQVARQLRESLDPSLFIQDWTELNQSLLEAFALEKWLFRILIGFMVAVSVLNLIGAILLAIFRQKKAMAILQALGLNRSQIRKMFTLEGFLLGSVGIFSGLLLGFAMIFTLKTFRLIAIDPEIYFLEKLPIDFAGPEVLIIALLSLIFVTAVSWWVSMRSASIPIREGLHGPG